LLLSASDAVLANWAIATSYCVNMPSEPGSGHKGVTSKNSDCTDFETSIQMSVAPSAPGGENDFLVATGL
jgi:hypothetical protein